MSIHGGAPLKFRVPVDIIKRSLDMLGGFPYEPGECKWDGMTLIIKGEKSKFVNVSSLYRNSGSNNGLRYVNNQNIPIAKQFFPRMRLETLDANHWGE